jgi:2-hydroxy-6-oxonona-2,4-dienedioate hydrolase
VKPLRSGHWQRSRAAPGRKRWPLMIITILLALGTAVVVSGFTRDIHQARKRVAAGSQLAQTACGPIEYASRGTGMPILVVHGAGGGFDQGLDFAGPLVGAGFRVIAVSRFGYLRTPMPADASAAAQADAHACLLDALAIDHAAVIGASAGAPSSLQLALRHPARCSALVLLVPAVHAPRAGNAPSVSTPPGTRLLFDTALRSDFIFWAAQRLAPSMVNRALLATPPGIIASADAAERARVARIQRNILPVSLRRLGLLNDAAVISTMERYPLERITTPTLAISAADDLFGTFEAARYTATQIPGARFISYPTGGHVWVGHHHEVTAAIAQFLQPGLDERGGESQP